MIIATRSKTVWPKGIHFSPTYLPDKNFMHLSLCHDAAETHSSSKTSDTTAMKSMLKIILFWFVVWRNGQPLGLTTKKWKQKKNKKQKNNVNLTQNLQVLDKLFSPAPGKDRVWRKWISLFKRQKKHIMMFQKYLMPFGNSWAGALPNSVHFYHTTHKVPSSINIKLFNYWTFNQIVEKCSFLVLHVLKHSSRKLQMSG